MRTYPFFGQGIGFPFRLDPAGGGVVVSSGNDDNISVALQYINERWTIREDASEAVNHIAESIAHILLTRPMEHDTLPPFGSELFVMVFEPNDDFFRLEAEHHFKFSTIRWEKRARIPDERDGVQWWWDGYLTDQGRLPVTVRVRFIVQQVSENLVAPFATTEQARLQEYPSSILDSNRHDLNSRYWGSTPVESSGYRHIRIPRVSPIAPASDDIFYRVKPKDTWLLISWELYEDIRFWSIIAQMYSNDSAAGGASRAVMDNCGDPEPGQILRAPSRARILTEFAGMA